MSAASMQVGAGSGIQAHSDNSPLRFVLIAGFLASTVLQSFAVRIGSISFPLVVPITDFLLIILFLSGAMKISLPAFGFFILQILLVLTSLSFASHPDVNSALYLIGLYGVWIFEFKQIGSLKAVRSIQMFHFFFAALGLFQFAFQFVGGDFLSLYKMLPDTILQPGFSYQNALSFGSHYYRANGFFFLEPSYFSRQMALALLIEIYLFQRISFLIIFASALLASVSGTGLIMLGTSLLFLGNRTMRTAIVASILMLILTATAITVIPQARTIAEKRLLEFSDPTKSGYQRFIAPYLADYVLVRAHGMPIVGQGPGSSERAIIGLFNFGKAQAGQDNMTLAYDVTFAKLLYEYGILGVVLFLVWSFWAFSRRVPVFLAASQLVSYWLLAGALLVAPQVLGTYWTIGLFSSMRPGTAK